MPTWFQNLLKGVYNNFVGTRTTYYSWKGDSTLRPMTQKQREAISRAFIKMDEAFSEIDKAFPDWK